MFAENIDLQVEIWIKQLRQLRKEEKDFDQVWDEVIHSAFSTTIGGIDKTNVNFAFLLKRGNSDTLADLISELVSINRRKASMFKDQVADFIATIIQTNKDLSSVLSGDDNKLTFVGFIVQLLESMHDLNYPAFTSYVIRQHILPTLVHLTPDERLAVPVQMVIQLIDVTQQMNIKIDELKQFLSYYIQGKLATHLPDELVISAIEWSRWSRDRNILESIYQRYLCPTYIEVEEHLQTGEPLISIPPQLMLEVIKLTRQFDDPIVLRNFYMNHISIRGFDRSILRIYRMQWNRELVEETIQLGSMFNDMETVEYAFAEYFKRGIINVSSLSLPTLRILRSLAEDKQDTKLISSLDRRIDHILHLRSTS